MCLVAVGGSGVGRDLLEKVLATLEMAKEKVPELRMVAVAGPRVDPESLPRPNGVEDLHGYVERLYRNLSVCDLAVVQGGLTTTMELTAAKRPLSVLPAQESLRAELPRPASSRAVRGGSLHGVPRPPTPDALAETIAAEIGKPARYRDVETDGARHAAEMIVDLI